MMSELQDQIIRQHCKTLRMPMIGSQFGRLAEAAAREGHSHLGDLEALLAAEMEERVSRAITRLLHEARLPRMKPLDAFEFDRSGVAASQLRTLAEGDYITKADPTYPPFLPLIRSCSTSGCENNIFTLPLGAQPGQLPSRVLLGQRFIRQVCEHSRCGGGHAIVDAVPGR